MRWLFVLVVTGCGFQPLASETASGDAPRGSDAATNVDTDGDGILDGDDNCPTIANPDQADWDGDHHGDVCDHCPHLASVDDPDGDGDGVGDACDPRPAIAGDRRVYWLPFTAPAEIATWTNTGGAWTVTGGELAQANNAFSLLDAPDQLGDVYFATSIEIVNATTNEIGFCGSDIQPAVQYYCCTVFDLAGPGVRAVSGWTGQGQLSSPVTFPGTAGVGSRIDVVGSMSGTASTCVFTQGTSSISTSTARGPSMPGTPVFYTLAAAHYRYAFVVAIGS